MRRKKKRLLRNQKRLKIHLQRHSELSYRSPGCSPSHRRRRSRRCIQSTTFTKEEKETAAKIVNFLRPFVRQRGEDNQLPTPHRYPNSGTSSSVSQRYRYYNRISFADSKIVAYIDARFSFTTPHGCWCIRCLP